MDGVRKFIRPESFLCLTQLNLYDCPLLIGVVPAHCGKASRQGHERNTAMVGMLAVKKCGKSTTKFFASNHPVTLCHGMELEQKTSPSSLSHRGGGCSPVGAAWVGESSGSIVNERATTGGVEAFADTLAVAVAR